jgi:phosphatidylserine/phosphatidylglycerophosphate/cardiolipin synthase-like enzyme
LITLALAAACAGKNKLHTSPAHADRDRPSAIPTATATPTFAPPTSTATTFYFATPSPEGLKPVADAIATARSSIKMIMFHLSEKSIIRALIEARARGVDVQLILDAKNLESKSSQKIANELKNAGIAVTPSSLEFSITHAKAMVIDDQRAIIMSLNLTTLFAKTRDYALTTEDPAVVREFSSVFETDVQNASAHTKNTPPLSCASLLWSPVNSESRLVGLIDSAKTSIITSTENLGDKAIENALAKAAARGVKTRVLAPLCDLNPNPLLNVPVVRELDAEKIDARLMPGPSSPELPYIHAKMMIVDDARAYVGSINFSENSTRHARELGILFDDKRAIAQISADFEADFAKAILPPADTDGVCGAHSEDVGGPP